jgi:membrane protease YdiL (CAAX protease family)
MPLEKADLLPRRWGVRESVVGLVAAVLFMRLLVMWLTSGVYYDGHVALLLSYAVVWVPLLAACAFACFISGTRSLRRDFGFRFTWLDALFGISIGLLARAVASLTEIAFFGRMSGLGVTFGEVVYDGWWVFGTLLAPILMAPLVEELFFRGLVLRTGSRLLSSLRSQHVALTISILCSAFLFSLLHLAEVNNVTSALVLGISTLTFGLGSSVLAALTGRIGGSIVAHMTFNASLILAALLA